MDKKNKIINFSEHMVELGITATRANVTTSARLKWSIVGIDDIPIDHLVEIH